VYGCAFGRTAAREGTDAKPVKGRPFGSCSAPQRRFVNDQELKASLTNGNSDLGRTPGVVHEVLPSDHISKPREAANLKRRNAPEGNLPKPIFFRFGQVALGCVPPLQIRSLTRFADVI
jgi:hypothetical protein